jgi:uncharacterized protein (DUF697 family)
MSEEAKQNTQDEVKVGEIIDDNLRAEQAEELCRWAAARAGVIVVAPLLGTMSLIANEVYMIMKLGKVYGEKLSEQAAVGLIGSMGAYFVGGTLTTLIPFPPMQIPVAIGTTYALGRVVTEWLKSGKPDDLSAFKTVYDDAMSAAKKNLGIFKDNPKKDEPLGDEKQHYEV